MGRQHKETWHALHCGDICAHLHASQLFASYKLLSNHIRRDQAVVEPSKVRDLYVACLGNFNFFWLRQETRDSRAGAAESAHNDVQQSQPAAQRRQQTFTAMQSSADQPERTHCPGSRLVTYGAVPCAPEGPAGVQRAGAMATPHKDGCCSQPAAKDGSVVRAPLALLANPDAICSAKGERKSGAKRRGVPHDTAPFVAASVPARSSPAMQTGSAPSAPSNHSLRPEIRTRAEKRDWHQPAALKGGSSGTDRKQPGSWLSLCA